ncbi:MAG: transferase [Proteobacteria bacterium]|nr:MAG: transferase [Pseudomonadota bacterium]
MTAATQAIILAAGRGSRMGEMTSTRPKCLTLLAGKPLLHWQLEALRLAGIQSITVIGGYRKDLLASESYQLIDNPDWASTNMIATLRCAADLLRQTPCLVTYSDIVYRPDRVKTLSEVDADIAISYDTDWKALWIARFENPLSDAETFRQKDGWLIDIGRKPERISDVEGQYIGLIKLTPAGWVQVEQVLSSLSIDVQRRTDVTNLLRILLDRGLRVRCVPGAGAWCEIDDSADVDLYQRSLQESDRNATRWHHDWRW